VSQLVGMCGLVCSECSAFKATQAGDAAAIAKVAEEWSQQYGGTFSPESVWCDGCTTAGRKCGHCGECDIRACGVERGLTTCAECGDYRCEKISRFLQSVPSAEQTLEARRAG
jgi:hypothetical protein